MLAVSASTIALKSVREHIMLFTSPLANLLHLRDNGWRKRMLLRSQLKSVRAVRRSFQRKDAAVAVSVSAYPIVDQYANKKASGHTKLGAR